MFSTRQIPVFIALLVISIATEGRSRAQKDDPFGGDVEPTELVDDPFGSAPKPVVPKKLDPFGDPLPANPDPFGPQKWIRMNPAGGIAKYRADSRDEVIKKAADEKLFPPIDQQLQKRIKIDIENFADERRVARKSADDLVQIGLDAVPQLVVATKSTDPTVAVRARFTIERLVDYTNLLLDGKGNPLAGATIEYTLASNKTVQIKSDRLGHVVLENMPFGIPVKVSHPDYENQIEATTDIFKPVWVKLDLRKKAAP